MVGIRAVHLYFDYKRYVFIYCNDIGRIHTI